jgi:PAS domain S-box-containing protein
MSAKIASCIPYSEDELKQIRLTEAAIFESAADAIISLAANNSIILFNAAAERMFRCSARAAIGQPISRFVSDWPQIPHHERGRASFGEANAADSLGGALETMTARRANKEEFPIEAAVSYATVAGMETSTLVIREISARVQSQMLQRVLLDAVPSSVLLLDHNLQVVLANKNFLEKSRRTESNTIGRPLADVFPKVILDEMGLEQRIRQAFQENRTTQGRRLTYRAPGVPLRIYYYSIIPAGWGTKVEKVMLLMDDVTEQVRLGQEIRRIECHLASVVECASDIVLSTDTNGRILTWNKAAERISGYSLDELKDRYFYECCATDVQRAKSLFAGGGTHVKSSDMDEFDLITKLGNPVRVSWVFSPMKDDMGHIVGVVAVGRDLTEQRKLEIQLIRSQKLAALGVMAGGIAHEIRNPLAVSASGAQFLMEEDITPEFRRDCAVKVHTGIQKASAIIESLLKFSSTSTSIEMQQVDLIPILKEAQALIANQAKIQRVEVNLNLPRDFVFILGIASLLEQLFMNLFLNALEAMPNQGTLSISAEKVEGAVLVRISDTGCGISSDNIGKIFDPFYTTSPPGRGIGLGLSICHSVVKQHFGSIEVNSVEGEGSRFVVRLPVL